ncbi:MAG: flagellar biosynthesis protein FlhF [Defluviitaleaceae bacterium]|nr:flagellar biosynthesis protein FlhF [Defluviitaleaceae bacterium]
MKIKKFTAPTELEAIEKIRKELGHDALVINVRKIPPKGFFKFLKKPQVEVSAAFDDGSEKEAFKDLMQAQALAASADAAKAAAVPAPEVVAKNNDSETQNLKDELQAKEDRIQMLSDMLLTTGDMLSRAQNQLSVSKHTSNLDRPRKFQNNLLQSFYDTLVENEVAPHIAEEILGELDTGEADNNLDINFIVKIVYNSLTNLIGEPRGLVPAPSKGNPQKFAFVGPTGVGKTTTIAKLTADMVLNKDLDVGLITADTYRIAAIEQLKTYGDILGIEVAVAYKPDDLVKHIDDKTHECDLILIDTAGRSHKHKENLAELGEFIAAVPDVEIFLVLSLTSKYEDMLNIVEVFSQFCEFKIIFTKMDETSKIGSIVNICHQTERKLSYITFGQNVPDDIKTISASDVAMILLGLGEHE